MSAKILYSSEDFKWYKMKLDVDVRYLHKHINIPYGYPCMVTSVYALNDMIGPPSYTHNFEYQTLIKCKYCGHEELGWA